MAKGTFKTSAAQYYANQIDAYLFNPPRRFIHLEKIHLIQANSKAWGNKRHNFTYDGEIFKLHDGDGPEGVRPNMVHSSLHQRLQEYLAERKKVIVEVTLVMSYITNVLTATTAHEDLQVLFPDGVYSCLYPQLGLTQEPVFTPAERTAFMQQHDKYIQMLCSRMLMNLIDVS